MNSDRRRSFLARVLAALCIAITGGILFAGLWPFSAPRNEVSWLSNGGIEFGHHGIAVSAGAFHPADPRSGCTIEIRLEPRHINESGTILAFDGFPNPRYPFALRQMGDSLAIQRTQYDTYGGLDRRWLLTPGVFAGDKPVTIAVTGSAASTTIYVNGKQINSSTDFGLAAVDLSGRLVVGNTTMKDGWPGRIFALAIFDSALSPQQVEQDAQGWLASRAGGSQSVSSPVALYRFDERSGTVVHDRTGSGNGLEGNDLEIRARYFQLHPAFIDPSWNQFRTRWDGWMRPGYWSDVVVNVLGFIPFGFLFAAYFGFVCHSERPRLWAAFAGIAVSLTIEISQYWLPTRDSSMTDVLTNTMGSAIGALLYRRSWETRFFGAPVGPGGHGTGESGG